MNWFIGPLLTRTIAGDAVLGSQLSPVVFPTCFNFVIITELLKMTRSPRTPFRGWYSLTFVLLQSPACLCLNILSRRVRAESYDPSNVDPHICAKRS